MRRPFRVAVVLFLLAILFSGSATVLFSLDNTILAVGLAVFLCMVVSFIVVALISNKKK